MHKLNLNRASGHTLMSWCDRDLPTLACEQRPEGRRDKAADSGALFISIWGTRTDTPRQAAGCLAGWEVSWDGESSAQAETEVRCIPVGKKSGGRGQGGNFGLIPDRGFETVALYLQGVPGRHRQEPSAKGEFNLPIASRARGLCAVDGTLRAATTGCPARWEVQMLRCSRAW